MNASVFAGGIILTVLRFIQGIGVGGEWGGSVLLSMEWAQSNQHRGFIASWPQFGVPAGLFLSNLAVLADERAVGRTIPDVGLARAILVQHHTGCGGIVHPPGHSGNPGIRPASRGAPD